jgi:hypothetical protein
MQGKARNNCDSTVMTLPYIADPEGPGEGKR